LFFTDKGVVENISDRHNTYVVVPADKDSNNIVFECKTYYIDCLVRELGINNNRGNPTYTPTSLSKEEILSNHPHPPRVLSPFRGGGLRTSVNRIAMLAGVLIFLIGLPKPDRLIDRGQTK